MDQEKKEQKNRAKKKLKATSINKEQLSRRFDGPKIKVLEFDHCIENHFKAINTISELCGDL